MVVWRWAAFERRMTQIVLAMNAGSTKTFSCPPQRRACGQTSRSPSTRSASGREQVLYVLGPGSHFNTVPMFDGGPCPANAQAQTAVSLLVLPRERLQQIVAQHPALALAM